MSQRTTDIVNKQREELDHLMKINKNVESLRANGVEQSTNMLTELSHTIMRYHKRTLPPTWPQTEFRFRQDTLNTDLSEHDLKISQMNTPNQRTIFVGDWSDYSEDINPKMMKVANHLCKVTNIVYLGLGLNR
eukprot:TRINITY_DN7597_c0_g1_i7.p1 TRINITY_DN7597_c0_g1~~TRINITY_DN7597_c0_g1_i7.p1  ORF type:complete len:133 (+),score=7.33 TRINITY_DN7597_c0_g1_i7:45-443(+)